MNEVIRTSGDVRRMLAETMQAVRRGEVDSAKGQTIAALAKELTASMQVELNATKVNMALRKEGMATRELSSLGKTLIGDDSAPTLDGTTR